MWLREKQIDGGRWNALYPFQLIVVEEQEDGTYAQKKATPTGTWLFTLPMSPESMSIEMPFAIQTHATMGGIVEEHGGAPFRMISLNGTTGIMFRGEETGVPEFSFLESVFAGTISAAKNTKQAFSNAVNGIQFASHAIPQSKFNDITDMGKLTGFYQFRLMQMFFEAYAELKKTKDGRTARLAFASHKDQSVYLVTPMDYRVNRAANTPLEYIYSLSFKAWKRIQLSKGVAEIVNSYSPIQRSPNKLAQALTSINRARQVLQGARTTIEAVGSDVQASLFTPMREVCLFIKDALSVPLSLGDLSDTIVQGMKEAILDLASTGSAVASFNQNFSDSQGRVTQNVLEIEEAIKQLAGEQGDDPKRLLSRTAHPANDPFQNMSANLDFFSGVQLGDLHVRPATASAIAAERDRVRKMSRLDFEKRRDSIAATAAAFANAVGLGDSTYNRIYGLTAPTSLVVDEPTDEDFQVLAALNDTITQLNSFVAVGGNNNSNSKANSIALVAGLASRSGIAFTTPTSKYAVPFPYGSTLEMLALRYLGTPGSWLEIASLNGLQEPYVDQEGFQLPLLVNGANNSVFVGDASNLFVGQPVWISSAAASRTQRRITKIDKLSPTNYMVTVDGEDDLDTFSTLAGAYLQAFLPNTVNSQQTIYIPSTVEPRTASFQTKAIPGVDVYDRLIAVGGIDLLLTPTNDLIIGSDGMTKWSLGLTNILQQVRLAISTRQGALLYHPTYGLPLSVGQSVAELSAADVLAKCSAMFAQNSTFAGLVTGNMSLAGGVARLNLAVGIAGTSEVIPVSADITH
jgi:hypothetical protein